MSVVICPPMDEEPWPTLGSFVCEWIEECLCHGPGDLVGQPIRLNDEQRAWIWRMYEVEPEKIETRKRQLVVRSLNPKAGRRRFQRCALSLAKGSAKTELAAWIAAAELHPEGPVRCAGFSGGQPIPRSVTDPYIPMIASSEEQSEELAYGALRVILQQVAAGSVFDIGLERIMRLDGHGKAEAVSASPSARDGARTTFQHADETHRLELDRAKRAWRVMLANLAKRAMADPWALETTTAPEPGAGSVAESTMDYAREVIAGRTKAPGLFYFHRQASDAHNLDTRKGLEAAIAEAAGPYAWVEPARIADMFQEPDADRPYLERVYLNRLVRSSERAFDMERWRDLAEPHFVVPAGSPIAIGFDGSRWDDATALVAVHIQSGHLWPLGIWQRPPELPDDVKWEVPVDEVDEAVADAFERWQVVRMYCDPPMWETLISAWSERYGKECVHEWWTNRRKAMAYATRSFVTAITAGELQHDGDAHFADHVGNARKKRTGMMDEEEKPLWIIRKERPESPKKIDAAVAAIIAWEARNDAVAAGEAVTKEPSMYFLDVGA